MKKRSSNPIRVRNRCLIDLWIIFGAILAPFYHPKPSKKIVIFHRISVDFLKCPGGESLAVEVCWKLSVLMFSDKIVALAAAACKSAKCMFQVVHL